MTVIHLPARQRSPLPAVEDTVPSRLPRPRAQVEARFRSPTGRLGRFVGGYRLKDVVVVRGQLFAVGVFSGALTDAGGELIGVAARSQRTPAVVVGPPTRRVVRLQASHVDLGGLVVETGDIEVAVPALRRVDGGRPTTRIRGSDAGSRSAVVGR
jgi:hypothetical protein